LRKETEQLKAALTNAAKEFKGETRLVSAEHEAAAATLTEWKSQANGAAEIKSFQTPKQLIKVLLNNKEFDGMLIYGSGGLGKTFLTINEVKKRLKPEEWEYSNGYVTPLALYKFLYDHKDKKVVVLDDLEGIFNNPKSLTLLKGALWEADRQRLVQYKTTAKEISDYPEAFIIHSKIIILCNQIPKQKDITTAAFISRTISYELNFTYQEKISICEEMLAKNAALTKEQKERITKILKEQTSEATEDLNFRTLKKLSAFVTASNGNAEKLFAATTNEDLTVKSFLEAEAIGGSVDEQVSNFNKLTSKSRATFFRIKNKLRKVSKSHTLPM